MTPDVRLDPTLPEPDVPVVPIRRVGRDALATFAYRVGGMPFAFAISIITSRYLLDNGRGAFVLALLTVTLAATAIGNVGVAATYELSRNEFEERHVISQAVIVTVLLGIVGAAVLFPIDYALADQEFRKVAFVALGLPGVLIVQTLTASLVAVGRLRLANVLQFLLPVATVVGMVAFVVWAGKGTTGAVFAWVAAQYIVAAVALVSSRPYWWPLSFGALPRSRVRAMFLLGLRLGVVNLVSLLNYRIELIVLEFSHGLAAVGIYSLATSLAELLWIVSSALATATVAPVVSADDDGTAAAIVARAVRGALIGTTILGVFLAIGGWFFISPVFGIYFQPAVTPLLILIAATIAFAPGSILAVYFSMRLGKTRIPLRISLISLTVTFVASVLLIPSHFVIGAAEACAAGYIAAMVAGLYWFARASGIRLRSLVPHPGDVRTLVGVVRGLGAR